MTAEIDAVARAAGITTDQAIAAIKALRNPSDAMLQAWRDAERDSTDGTLVFTRTVRQDHPVDKANFEQLLRELIGAVHDVMIVWNVL